MGRAARLSTLRHDRFAAVLGVKRGLSRVQMHAHWDDTVDARRDRSGRAPLPPGASELEHYIHQHCQHRRFSAVVDTPSKDFALVVCSHSDEVGHHFLADLAETRRLCERYKVALVSREAHAARRRAELQ
jgi:hypothetical protein